MFHTVLFFMTICEGTWDFHGGNCGNFAFPVVTRRFQKSEEITQGGSEVNRLKKMTSNTHTHAFRWKGEHTSGFWPL